MKNIITDNFCASRHVAICFRWLENVKQAEQGKSAPKNIKPAEFNDYRGLITLAPYLQTILIRPASASMMTRCDI